MNANELADGILAIEERIFLTKKEHQLFQNSAAMLRQQQDEIERLIMLCDCMTTESNRKGNELEALNELNTMLKDAIEKRIGLDAERYKWLRAEFAAGRETYLAEGIPSGESLDKYIDEQLRKAQEK